MRREELLEVLAALAEFEEQINKERRYCAYREAAHLLQYGGREKLPTCVEGRVKKEFPSENAGYVGFKVDLGFRVFVKFHLHLRSSVHL